MSRGLIVVLAAGAAVPVSYLTRLFLRQDRLIFRPGPLLSRSNPGWEPYEDVVLPADERDGTGSAPIRAIWFDAPGTRKVVIFFHGSDGNTTHELGTIRFLRSLGVRLLAVEYPGYPFAGSSVATRRPHERGCYEAADAAWRYVTEVHAVPPEQVYLFGHSLGGAVATYLAAGRGRACGGLVLQSTFTSVPDLAARAFPYLPVRPFCRTRMNTRRRIRDVGCDVLLIHSADDEHIPFEHARRLFGASVGAGARRLVQLNGSHADRGWQRSPEVAGAWRELLEGRTGGWEPAKGGDLHHDGDDSLGAARAYLPPKPH